MDKPNIYQRINAVMKEVDYVKKDKAVSGGGANYKAVTHDQAVAVIRKALVSHGIVVQPVQKHGEFLQMRDLNAQPVAIKMGLYSGTYDFTSVFFFLLISLTINRGAKRPKGVRKGREAAATEKGVR